MRRIIEGEYKGRPITKVQELRVAIQKFFTTDPKAKLYMYERKRINKENFTKGRWLPHISLVLINFSLFSNIRSVWRS